MAVVAAGLQASVADPVEDDISAVIAAQIDAFRAGDFNEAFSFASDGIRAIFGTPENFGTMVERGYAMVIAPAEVQYTELRDEGGALMQRVLIRDGAGVWHALDYRMIKEDGAWRISGVELLGEPAVGA
jgi:hypothetical protein